MTVRDVGQCLASLGLDQYIAAFEREKVSLELYFI
jgi:hypothetical protein